jgi:hypothetical protein
VAELDTSCPSVRRIRTRVGLVSAASPCVASRTPSYRAVPRTSSTASERSASSASTVVDAKLVSCTALRPTATTAIRSRRGFATTNVRAAADASRIACPSIDWERSTSSATLFCRPRLTARMPTTGRPFSVSFGALPTGFGVTTVARTVGYPAASSAAIFGPAAAASPGTARQRMAKLRRSRRLMRRPRTGRH